MLKTWREGPRDNSQERGPNGFKAGGLLHKYIHYSIRMTSKVSGSFVLIGKTPFSFWPCRCVGSRSWGGGTRGTGLSRTRVHPQVVLFLALILIFIENIKFLFFKKKKKLSVSKENYQWN